MSNIIEVQNLTKKYKDFVAVDNISFTVAKGEVFAFLANGAGKTTTIKMLTTLLQPDAGELKIDGYDCVSQQHEVRHSFGIVFQDPSLDDELTAYENMYYHAVLFQVPKNIRQKKIQEMMEFVELWDRKKELVKNFSGGMKRRLEIARGLLHQPKVLFLDEPTLGLDPQTTNHIWRYIQDLNKKNGVTVFFTTHYMAEAEKVASQIAVIDHGKIVDRGTVADLEQKTKTNSLEEAFLALTGKNIRDEEVTGTDRMRQRRTLFKH